MGTCRFCRMDAGPLRKQHQRCRERREGAIRYIHNLANRELAKPGFDEAAMRDSIAVMSARAHVTEQETNAAIAASWTRGIGHPRCGPVTHDEAQRQRFFRELLISQNRLEDLISDDDMRWMKLTERFLVRAHRAALGQEDDHLLLEDLEEAYWDDRTICRETGQWIMARGWEKAVANALEEGVITLEREVQLVRYADRNRSHMESVAWGDSHRDLVQSAILRDISQCVIPQHRQYLRDLSIPLEVNEHLVWVSDYVGYLGDLRHRRREPRREGGVGGSDGTYHPPSSFWNPDIGPERGWPDDTGLLAATTNGLRFAGTEKRFHIRFDRIGAFEPYGNGIGIGQKTRRGKLQGFVTGDGWFIYNLLINLAANLGRLIPPLDVPRTYENILRMDHQDEPEN